MSRESQKQNLSNLLIDYCDENNVSGNQLAARLGVSQPSAQSYLDGRTYPNEDTRARIARLLRITPRELQAKIDGVELAQDLSPDELAQEIRSLSEAEFYAKIVPVVFDRILADRQSRTR